MLQLTNLGVKQFEQVDRGAKELDLQKATGHMSLRQKMLLQLFGSEAVKKHFNSDVSKASRLIVGAESLQNGICMHIEQKELILQVMKYMQCFNEARFDSLLLNLCETKPHLLETVLYSQPAKTLEVGYLQVRQIDPRDEALLDKLTPWINCITLLKDMQSTHKSALAQEIFTLLKLSKQL